MNCIRRQPAVVIVLMVIAGLVFTLTMQGCTFPQTAKGKYLTALKTFNTNADRLADYRDSLPKAEKEKFNETAQPIIQAASTTLSAWSLALHSKNPTANYEAEWGILLIKILRLVNAYL